MCAACPVRTLIVALGLHDSTRPLHLLTGLVVTLSLERYTHHRGGCPDLCLLHLQALIISIRLIRNFHPLDKLIHSEVAVS